ncbi:MAG: cysteine hydrolase family protein [Reinekea sp.]
MKQNALILFDIQNDYFPVGAMPLHEPELAVVKARTALDNFRAHSRPIIHIQHCNLRPDGGFMLPDTAGVEIHERVQPAPGEPVIIKHCPNAFWQTDLEAQLKALGINQLVIAGMMSQMCVSATSRAAMERGFGVKVIADACAAPGLSFFGEQIDATTVHKTALAELTLFAELIKTSDLT